MYDCAEIGEAAGLPQIPIVVTLEVGHDESALKELVQLNDCTDNTQNCWTHAGETLLPTRMLTPISLLRFWVTLSGDKLKAREMLAHYEQHKACVQRRDVATTCEKFLRTNLPGF